MAKFYPELDDSLRQFIADQKLFFVATAPNDGRISLSPKGLDTLRILDNQRVLYLDLTGSSNETAAHLRQNGRMTMMFCALEGEPMILRLYGHGEVIRRDDREWAALGPLFPSYPGARQIMVLNIESVQTSCGAGVPLFGYQGERDKLLRWAEKKGENGIRDYWRDKNQFSIDGLPTGLLPD